MITKPPLFNLPNSSLSITSKKKSKSPYYSAARLWTDAVINPLETRTWISMGIEAANHAPINKQFNMGVLQV